MTVSSKFDTGMVVWFLARPRNESSKYFEGRIVIPEKWDRNTGWMYTVERITEGGGLSYSVLENDIYLTKEEAIEEVFVPSEVPLLVNASTPEEGEEVEDKGE